MAKIIDANLGLEDLYQWGNKAFQLGGPIQRFVDSVIMKGVEPYVPMRKGTLTKSVIFHSRIGQGQLKWQTPYARRLYYGIGYNFDKSRHPLAGAKWSERYKTEHLQELRTMIGNKVAKELGNK